MTTCPDFDRLMDVAGESVPDELAVHVDSCTRCQHDLSWMRLVPDAITGEDLEVSEELQRKTLEALGSLPVGDEERVGFGGRMTVGMLSAATVALALWVTGSAGSAGASSLLAVSCGVGCAFTMADAALARREEGRMERG